MQHWQFSFPLFLFVLKEEINWTIDQDLVLQSWNIFDQFCYLPPAFRLTDNDGFASFFHVFFYFMISQNVRRYSNADNSKNNCGIKYRQA